MYKIDVCGAFSAAHRLPGTGGRCERLHGHNWKVEVRAAAAELDASGMVLNFHDVKAAVREVLEAFDHRLLNDLPAFERCPPTAENLARTIHDALAGRLATSRVRLTRVRVWESDGTAASYSAPAGPPP